MRNPMKFPIDIGSLIGGFKGTKFSANPVWQLGHKWEMLAGASVAMHSHPARVSNGILYVTLPKEKPEEKIVRRIPVKAEATENKEEDKG